MFGYIAGGALIGGAAGVAGASLGIAAAAGASGVEAAMAGGMMGGLTAGGINGGGMTALAGGSFNDIYAGMVSGSVIGGFSGFAAGSAHFGTEHLLHNMDLFKSLNPLLKNAKNLTVGKNPLHNTISYMAGSTASQITSNLLSGKKLFEEVDYGLNLGILVPLFADVGSRFSGVREYQLRKQHKSDDGYEIKRVAGFSPGTRLGKNGDLTVGTFYSSEKYISDYYRNNFFGKQVFVPGHMHTKPINFSSPVLMYNYRGLIFSLFNTKIGIR